MARNSKVSLVLVGIVFLFTILAGVANAKGATPSMFATKEGCESAVNAGEGAYKFYVPKYFGGSKKNPVDGVTSVVAPLEGVGCAEMDTTAGRKFVPQAEGTEFRFRVKADGSLEDTPYARHDCGNKVYSISYPQETVSHPAPKAATQKADTAKSPTMLSKADADLVPIRDVCGERRLFGERFTNKIDEYGRPYCEEDIPWYKTTAGVIVIGAAAVGVGYCAVSGRCGFWKRGGGGGGSSSILTGPSGGGTGIGEVISAGGGGIP